MYTAKEAAEYSNQSKNTNAETAILEAIKKGNFFTYIDKQYFTAVKHVELLQRGFTVKPTPEDIFMEISWLP